MLVVVILDHVESKRCIGIVPLQLRKRDRSRFRETERLETGTVSVAVQVRLHLRGNIQIIVAQVQHAKRAVLAQKSRDIVLIQPGRTRQFAEHALRNVRRTEMATTPSKEFAIRINLQFFAIVQPHVDKHFRLVVVQAIGPLDLLHAPIDTVPFRHSTRKHLHGVLLEIFANEILHLLVKERRHRRWLDIGDGLEQVIGHLVTGAQLDFLTVTADLAKEPAVAKLSVHLDLIRFVERAIFIEYVIEEIVINGITIPAIVEFDRLLFLLRDRVLRLNITAKNLDKSVHDGTAVRLAHQSNCNFLVKAFGAVADNAHPIFQNLEIRKI